MALKIFYSSQFVDNLETILKSMMKEMVATATAKNS